MTVIASQNFNDLTGSTSNNDQFPAGSVAALLTNAAASNLDPLLGLTFQTFWTDTRGNEGPTQGTESGDFIGANSFGGSNAPDVAADGTAVGSTEKNFQFNDGDGLLALTFDPVDLSGYKNTTLSLDYWINNTGYESTDRFFVEISDGSSTFNVLDFGEPGLEASASVDDGTANWGTLTVDLDALVAVGLDRSAVTVTIGVDTNSGSENVFVDNVTFSGDALLRLTQSFEEEVPAARYQDTGDAGVDHDLVNNAGQSPVDSTAANTGIGFDARYVNTRGDVGLTDGDFVGVTGFTGDVGAFTDGVQGYQLSDTDGLMVLEFDTIDLSTAGPVALSIDYFVDSTGWEAEDVIRIWVETDLGDLAIFDTTGQDIDDLGVEGVWQTGAVNLGADVSSATLFVSLDSNSSSENLYIDNILVEEASGAPGVLLVDADDLLVSEDGAVDSFAVGLNTEPAAPVAVTLTADGQTELSLDGTSFSSTVTLSLSDTARSTVTVRAIDDAAIEAKPHSGGIAVTVTSADPAYDGLAVDPLNVVVEDNDFVTTLIHEIQGTGSASMIEGQVVKIQAVVVGDFQGSGEIGGFFVQEEDADADGNAASSEGIFISGFRADVFVDVGVGDIVEIVGEVDEFSGLTQLASVSQIVVLGTAAQLPTAATVTLPIVQDLESVEGMRVVVEGGDDIPVTVTENFNLDRFGEVAVSAGNKIQPTQLFDAQDQAAEVAALTAENAANRLTIDDGRTGSNPDIYRLIDSGDGTPLEAGDPIGPDGPTLRLGAEIEPGSLTGVMDFRFGAYRVQSDGPLDTVEGTNAGARPDVAPDVGGDLKVASFNVLNYFTTLVGGRGATTPEDLARQTTKIVNAILELDADVLGLQEVENNGFGAGSAIAALVDALNAELGSEVYAFVDPRTPEEQAAGDLIGTDAITTGIIYKQDVVRLVGADFLVFDEASAETTFLAAEGQIADLQRNRPATAASFETADGAVFAVAANHFKSKGSSGLAGVTVDGIQDDPNFDQGDGQGFWNAARADAAAELAAWLATDPTGSGDPDVLVLGDLNAYAQEDPVQAIEAAGYTDLGQQFIGPDAYSFVFSGQRGTLDYGLANDAMAGQVTGAAEWHINADEPDLLNYSSRFNDASFYNGGDFYAASDHDPLVIGLDLTGPDATEVMVAFDRDDDDPIAIESIDGERVRVSELDDDDWDDDDDGSGGLVFEETALAFSAGDAEFVFRRGALGIDSDRGRKLIDGDETLTVSLLDDTDFGDAYNVSFDFGRVRGNGEVQLSFYEDGLLVEQATGDASSGTVFHDLLGSQTFDQIELTMLGDTRVSIDGVVFDRQDFDTLLV